MARRAPVRLSSGKEMRPVRTLAHPSRAGRRRLTSAIETRAVLVVNKIRRRWNGREGLAAAMGRKRRSSRRRETEEGVGVRFRLECWVDGDKVVDGRVLVRGVGELS